MKKLIPVLFAVVAVGLLSGCAGLSPVVGGTAGGIYTDVSGPVAVGTGGGYSKVGVAKSTGIICIATGDASIAAAMKNGGITKIHHVDHKSKSVLGVYSEYTTTVYGE